jgi:hypothetical protein
MRAAWRARSGRSAGQGAVLGVPRPASAVHTAAAPSPTLPRHRTPASSSSQPALTVPGTHEVLFAHASRHLLGSRYLLSLAWEMRVDPRTWRAGWLPSRPRKAVGSVNNISKATCKGAHLKSASRLKM